MKAAKRLISEALMIAMVSFLVALGVNAVRGAGLPVLHTYVPPASAEPADLDGVAKIDLETLRALMENGMVTLVDAREAAAYGQGHIPGARNLPLADRATAFSRMEKELKSGRTVVTYCINPECLDSTVLAAWLKEKGVLDVLVFRGGIEGWRAAGYREESRMGDLL